MKNIRLILFALVAFTMVTSCIVDDEPDNSYAEGSYFVGFGQKIAAVSYFADEGVVLKNYPVKVLGGSNGSLPDQDIVISYVVDPSSTAVEGQEYNFVTNTGTLLLPAGSTYVNFPLNVNTGGFDEEMPTTLVLKLTGTSTEGTVVSSLSNKLTITFVGCQADLDEYMYDVVITRDGAVTNRPSEPIYQDGINEFRTRITGTFTPGQQGTDPSMGGLSFSVLCGEINLPTQGLFQGQFSNEVTDNGTGSVNPDGSFTLKFNVSGVAGDFEQTYTRQ